MGKVAAVKYRLTQAQLRALTVSKRPALRSDGSTELVKNPDGKPYRFSDGTPGAPSGFGVYVGPTGVYYEVRLRVEKKAARIALGSAQELTLADAHALASAKRQVVRESGLHPKEIIRRTREAREAKAATVGEAMENYAEHLRNLVDQGKAKTSGLEGVQDSLARLQRPEVGLANQPIATLTDEQVIDSWAKLRHSAMLRSNRLPQEVKSKLQRYGQWWKLSRADLVTKLRLSGKDVALAYAAGMAAAEHTMGDARRAVERLIARERKEAARNERQPVLFHNPFEVLGEKAMYRSTRELGKHYDAARVRNPLGVDDTESGQKSLPSVLKSLLGRRDMQNGWNSTAVDYALLTLLWGTRRNEGARLRWYDSCSKDELRHELASWAWIAPDRDTKNPSTGLRGSQVFLHDTKTSEVQILPVAYFAERVLRWRLDARKQAEKELAEDLVRAKKAVATARSESPGSHKLAQAIASMERVQWRLDNAKRWIFPARNPKAKEGYYSDSKSLLRTVRQDAGLLDVAREIDIGLTPHDFRRTLGRFASKLLPGHVVSQLLRHHKREPGEDMEKVTDRYAQQEWPDLREAMEKVDEAIIATSPRAWNILKGSDRPRLDEVNDPELVVPRYRARHDRDQT